MKKRLFFLFILFSFCSGIAQNAADIETSFGPIPGFNGIILATAQQPDGKILVGGSFTTYKGITCNYFTRLLSDGTVDSTFNLETTIWYGVTSILIQPDGKILIGGGYNTPINGLKVGIIRLNIDGSTDYTFDAVEKFGGVAIIKKINLQSDGKIILIGGFTAYDSVSRNGIVRINPDGSLDTTFDPGTGFGGGVNSIALQPDGKMIIVGDFTNYNGYTRNRIIRLNTDASVDLTFTIGVGFNSETKFILIQSNGRIVVAGSFSTYKNVSKNNVIGLLTNGDIDTAFNTGTGFQGSQSTLSINDMKNDNFDNIIIAGRFTIFNDVNTSNCVRLNSNGSVDLTFEVVGAQQLYSVFIQNDQKILLGGDNYISRINNFGTLDYTFDYGSGFNNSVKATIVQVDGKILVGGYFKLYNLHQENGLVRLNANGTKDNTFSINYLDYCQIDQMILQPNGKVIVNGTFRYANSGNYFHNMRLNADGSQDMTFDSTNLGNFVAHAIQPDGKILLYSGGQVKRLNSNGTVDYTFNTGSGFNNYVYSVALQPDGRIIIVGNFSIFNSEQHLGIVRLLPNGSLDTTFNTGEGFNTNTSPRTITLQPDGKILVAGSINSYNLNPSWGIVRINTDGSYDSTFNPGFSIGNVNSIAIQTDGKIVAGGYKSYFSGNYLTNLLRFNSDGSVDTTFDMGTGFDMGDNNSYVSKLNLQPDGKIIVTGSFKNYKSVGSSNLVRLYGGNSTLTNENFTNYKLILSPNPTHDFINVNLPFEILNLDYQIFDLTGNLIIQDTSKESVINIQSLSRGVYILKLKGEKKQYVSKFIKE